MRYDPQKHHRCSIRLKGYDYSQPGEYYITIVTQNRECLFGNVVDGKMILNENGLIVKKIWNDLPNHYYIRLNEYVIMPNHIHGIIIINNNIVVGAIHESPLRHESPLLQTNIKKRRKMMLPKLIGRFKTLSSKHINMLRKTPGRKLWQRNYWEHIIRDKNEFNRISKYIIYNPLKWQLDDENPDYFKM